MPGENQNPAAPVAAPAAPAAAAPAAPVVAAKPASEPPAPAAPKDDGPVLGAENPTPAVATVPEKYDFKAPEGQQLDNTLIEAFTPLFKELGLSQESAQKLVDKQFEATTSLAKAFDKEVQDSIAKQNAEWVKQSRDDKEFGGADFEKNSKIADKAFALLATPELKALFKESGYDRHPEIVRLFWKVGQKLGESTPPGNSVPAGGNSITQTLYPSMQAAH